MALIRCGAGGGELEMLNNQFAQTNPYTFTFTENASKGLLLIDVAKYNANLPYTVNVSKTGNVTLTPKDVSFTNLSNFGDSRAYGYYELSGISAGDTITISSTNTAGSGALSPMYWIVTE